MDPAFLDYLLIAAAGFAATTAGFAAAWLRARERAIRAEARLSAADEARVGAGADVRFDRLEQIAEASALEIERVSEAQRFQAKLLAGRSPDQSGRPPLGAGDLGRIVTPH